MPVNPGSETYSAFLDEPTESWRVKTCAGGSLPLDRTSLSRLISLYNQIHRGNPLTLIERRALHELGHERTSLHETIRNLYDFIDAECGPEWEPGLPDPGLACGSPRAGTGPAAPESGRPRKGFLGLLHRATRLLRSRA